MKKVIYFLLVLLLIAATAGRLWFRTSASLLVIFLNVGQGDATVIRTPQGQTILIDGGPDRTILSKLGKYLPWTEKVIDLAVLSHPHADHLAGLNYILERYQVKHILMTEAVHTTPDYFHFLELIKKHNIPVTIALSGQEFLFDDGIVKLQTIWPDRSLAKERLTDLNSSSIVNRLVYGTTAVLFTGDTPVANEMSILNSGQTVRADILKVAHQGSRTSSSDEFLRTVSPQVAVISVGRNSYGHPHTEVIDRLQHLVAQVLRTDQQGDIIFISDGDKFNRRYNLIFSAFVLP